MAWADAHQRAAVLAAELHADLKIPLDRPVDVFDAVRRSGLVLAFASLGRVSGLYLPEGRSKGILLHSGHPRTRQRYTAAHELGHHAFGHATEVDTDLEAMLRGDIDRWPEHEKEAEAFGAWFLMPRRLLRVGLSALGIVQPRSPFDVYALSLWLGTSYTATVRHLATTNLVTGDDASTWLRTAPRDLKRALAGAFTPDDLRHDVWWLDSRVKAASIDTRPGDRVVLTLDEIPSSGYTWRFTNLPAGVRVLADSAEDEWEPRRDGGDPSPASDDTAGQAHPRSFLLEIEESIEPQPTDPPTQLELVKAQPWQLHSAPFDDFHLSIQVHAPLHGIQEPSDAFALTA